MSRSSKLVLAVGVALIVGFAVALFRPAGDVPSSASRKPLFYRHPMTPSITSPVPAKDDMGMDYIPVYADEAAESDAAVRISPAMEQNLGVRTAAVLEETLARDIETVGYVEFDERLISQVNLRVEGWIEDLQVRTFGEPVKKGDLLFRLYSRELEIAQREYLQTVYEGGGLLRKGGVERLKALGMDPADIERLDQTRQPVPLVPVYARQDGVVAELNAREGMFVTPGTTVMTLAGLDQVWVQVDVFEQQADWVRVGQPAEIRAPHKPGEVLEGKVEFIYPRLDPETRTLKVRLTLPNPEQSLKPNMYVDATLRTDPRRVLSVPAEAVIRTGEGARVILALGEGRFDPVPVITGIESGGRIEIRKGIGKGDRVVTSAQFLLDSEASLQAGLRRLQVTGDQPAPGKPAISAEGTLDAIAGEARTVTVSHGPVPELGWPAMTMSFAVAEGIDLSVFETGETVHFEFEQTEAGPVIVSLTAGSEE